MNRKVMATALRGTKHKGKVKTPGICSLLGLRPFTPHDLRRTAATLAGDLGSRVLTPFRRGHGTDDADEIDYCVMDVFDFAPPVPIDFVVSSLVTHHMSDDLIAKFLRWMEETARKGWLIYDLQRHPVPYYFITLMGTLTRLHPMVIHDGRISVARSLTRREWL